MGRQALAAEPLRESSVLLLVRALAAAGDQAGALAAFNEYRDLLAAETGLEPTPRPATRSGLAATRQRPGSRPPRRHPGPPG